MREGFWSSRVGSWLNEWKEMGGEEKERKEDKAGCGPGIEASVIRFAFLLLLRFRVSARLPVRTSQRQPLPDPLLISRRGRLRF